MVLYDRSSSRCYEKARAYHRPKRHLLGRKSWNPYSPAAIARVKADEAAAVASQEADEQRQLEHDSAKRLAILKGETPPQSPPRVEEHETHGRHGAKRERNELSDQKRKRRKLHGEDDTDRDMRIAREDNKKQYERDVKSRENGSKRKSNLPITDIAGNIQLFTSAENRRKKDPSNLSQTKVEQEEYGAMQLKDAAGYRKEVKDQPWYLSCSRDDGARGRSIRPVTRAGQDLDIAQQNAKTQAKSKRAAARMEAADPLAAINAAAKKMKENREQRELWAKEKEAELESLRREQDEDMRKERTVHRHRHRKQRHGRRENHERESVASSDRDRSRRHRGHGSRARHAEHDQHRGHEPPSHRDHKNSDGHRSSI